MVYAPRQEPSAPPMYPTESIRPIPPVRSEYNQNPQEQALLPPRVPDRMDKQSPRSYADVGSRRVNIQSIIEIFLKEFDYITILTYNSFVFNTKLNQLVLIYS